MSNSKCLTTREVAQLCRVSDATVKRWEDAGLLRSERTSGGHRRFRAEEVARFQRQQGLGLKHFHGDESIFTATAATRRDVKTYPDSPFFNSLLAGCEERAANLLIDEYLREKPLAHIFDDSVCAAMRRIGELWCDGEITITQEHLATRTALCAIYKLRSILPASETIGELGMCCAVENDFHELPAYLAQVILENEGWEVMNFGANTPLYALTEEVLRYQPKMICITATMINDIERLFRDYQSFTEQADKIETSVIFGGRAFNDQQIRRRFSTACHAESFVELAEFARDLAGKD
jgi:MerR family transcriptional regulator, light-induced transcriptional regulator